jgi:hypothetical protein
MVDSIFSFITYLSVKKHLKKTYDYSLEDISSFTKYVIKYELKIINGKYQKILFTKIYTIIWIMCKSDNIMCTTTILYSSIYP